MTRGGVPGSQHAGGRGGGRRAQRADEELAASQRAEHRVSVGWVGVEGGGGAQHPGDGELTVGGVQRGDERRFELCRRDLAEPLDGTLVATLDGRGGDVAVGAAHPTEPDRPVVGRGHRDQVTLVDVVDEGPDPGGPGGAGGRRGVGVGVVDAGGDRGERVDPLEVLEGGEPEHGGVLVDGGSGLTRVGTHEPQRHFPHTSPS